AAREQGRAKVGRGRQLLGVHPSLGRCVLPALPSAASRGRPLVSGFAQFPVSYELDYRTLSNLYIGFYRSCLYSVRERKAATMANGTTPPIDAQLSGRSAPPLRISLRRPRLMNL